MTEKKFRKFASNLDGSKFRDLAEAAVDRDYIVFDRTGTPHVVVAVKTEIGGNCQQSGNREGEITTCLQPNGTKGHGGLITTDYNRGQGNE